MSFSQEDSVYLNHLLDKYALGISISVDKEGNEFFMLYQNVKEADSLEEILHWIIMEFEEK